MTPTEQLQQQLVRSGLEKQRLGQKATREEAAAVKRFVREKEERERIAYYRTVPQKHYVQMSGRQPKILKDQEALYGLPVGQKMVDLFAALRAFHDFLAKHGHKLLKPDEPGLLNGPPTESLERLRLAKAKREEFAYDRDMKLYRRVDEIQQGLAIFSGVVRQAIETLARQYGDGAREIIAEGIEDAISALRRAASGNHADEPNAGTADDDLG